MLTPFKDRFTIICRHSLATSIEFFLGTSLISLVFFWKIVKLDKRLTNEDLTNISNTNVCKKSPVKNCTSAKLMLIPLTTKMNICLFLANV